MMPNLDESILDDCLLEIAAGRLSVEDCLRLYPQEAAQLEPLLSVAARVHSVPKPPALSAEKRRAIEQQLLSRAVQSKTRMASGRTVAAARRSLRLRFSLAVAALTALLLAGAGTVTASASSVPGELLYPIKRLSEQVSISLASSADQAAIHVDLAQRRLDEFNILSDRGDVRPELMTDASQEIAAAMQASELLTSEQQQAVLAAVVRVTEAQLSAIAGKSASASQTVKLLLESNSNVVSAARARALGLVKQEQKPPRPIEPGNPHPTDTIAATSIQTDVSDTPTVLAPTATPKPKNTVPAVKPTDKLTHTPRPVNTPPGQVKTPKPTEPKPEHTPPGQIDKTPRPKK